MLKRTTSDGKAAMKPNGPKCLRLTRLQKAIVEFMGRQGGSHVYISRSTVPPVDSDLRGFTWEGVNLSLRSLLRAGVIIKSGKNDGFFSLAPSSN